MARLQYTIPDNLQKKANMIFEAQGITPKIAIKMFYIEVVKKRGLPFKPSRVKIPNDLTLETFSKTDKGIELEGPFKTTEELFKSLEK